MPFPREHWEQYDLDLYHELHWELYGILSDKIIMSEPHGQYHELDLEVQKTLRQILECAANCF